MLLALCLILSFAFTAQPAAQLTPLDSQPAFTTPVLDLDGKDSYVELPPNLFTNDVVTVEGWVKWREFGAYSRFFEFSDAALMVGIINFDQSSELAFQRVLTARYAGQTMSHAPGQLVLGQWVHLAIVAGTNFSKVYCNGHLLATSTTTNSWSPGSVPVLKNFLGRSVVKEAGNNPDFDGQMAEVRLWAGERTADEIRANLFHRLTGRESELLALWNFADGTARDATPNGRDGILEGGARVTEGALPTDTTLAPWLRLILQFSDRTGTPLRSVNVRAEAEGVPVGRATSDAQGVAPLSMWTTAPAVDLVASSTNDLGGWQKAVAITPYAERTNGWKLGRALEIGGRAVALDGRTPQANLVVELVRPDDGSGRREEAELSNSEELRLASVTTNRVLQLDGSTNSFVELPTDLLAGAQEMTFEAWLKWDVFGYYPTAFHLGYPSRRLILGIGDQSDEAFGLDTDSGAIWPSLVYSDGPIELHQWRHVAGVVSTNGLRLYLNGSLVNTNGYREGLFTNGPVQRAFLGRHLSDGLDPFRGEMDEVRLWRTARTPEQISENIGRSLTGSEEGLVGLWNFDDPANPGRDASPGAHQGKLLGQATITNSALPVVVFGNITDAAGNPLTNASVEIHQAGQPDRRATANAAGEYALTANPSELCDLFATTGELSAYRLGFQPSGESQQRVDWVLTEAGTASSSRREEARTAKSEIRNQKSEIQANLLTSAATSLGPGTIVATVLTDEQGNFHFTNVPPGAYQVRAQIPGGRAWYEAGRILLANPDARDAERARLTKLDFQLAPFNKGRWKKYGVLDGLKNNNMGVSFFGPDGALSNYAWEGLVRFDGREFLNLSIDRRVGGIAISPLGAYRDDSGQFWIGTSDGLWRYRPDDGSPASRFPMPGHPDENEIIEVTGTADGAVWVRTPKALARYLGDQGTVFTNLWEPDPSLSEPRVQALVFPRRMAAAGNRLWLTGPGVGLIRFDGTNQVRWTSKDGLPSADTGTVTTSPNGDVWFAVGAAGVVRFDGTNFFRLTQQNGLPSGTITAIHISRNQRVWFGTADGTVAQYDGRSFAYFDTATDLAGRKNSEFGGECWDIQDGPDGGLWFGTAAGLWRFEENTLKQYHTTDGLPTEGVNALLAGPDGSITALLGTNGMARFDGQRFRSRAVSIPATAMVPGPGRMIYAALTSVPTAPERIAILQADRILSTITNTAGLMGNQFVTLARAADGAIWAGTAANGVVRFAGTNGVVTLVRTNGLLANPINAIHCDPKGNVWFAVNGGIVRFDGSDWQEFTPAEGAPGRRVSSIETASDGSVWFGARDGGLSRFDGQVMKPIPPGVGEFVPSVVFKIFRAADNSLWFATITGVTHYDGINWVPLGEGDGMLPGVPNAIAQDASGGMWFGGEDGLIRYDPVVATNPTPSLAVQTDRDYTDMKALPEITAGRLVTFKASSVDFRTRPENRLYRYAVVPGRVDSAPAKAASEWQPATRDAEFSWPTRSPGDYTFFAQSIDRDLNYSTPAVAHLTIVPPWYANAWIMVPSGGFLLGLAGWALVARSLVVRRKREAEQLREQLLQQERRSKTALELEVAERKRAEEYYQTLVETIPHIVIRKDREGRYTFVNGISRQWAGFRGRDMLGQDDSIWAPPELAREILRLDLEVVATGKTIELVRPIEVPGFIPRLFLHSIRSPIRDEQGQIVGVQMLAWDVTHEKEAEEALRLAKEQADDANRTKSQFLASMSHELRTPLTAIIGFSELLQGGAEADGRKEDVEDIARIHDSATHLLGLINGILDLSKVEAGKMTLYLEDFDVGPMIQEVVATVQPLLTKNGNQLEVVCPKDIGRMRADLTKVRQVLFNLLSNANKFTEKGVITLRVDRMGEGTMKNEECKMEDGISGESILHSSFSLLHFQVSDTGIGMTPEQLGRLFQAFSQADAATSKKYGGTGLGLAISRKFCELMGGRLDVESVAGQGSTFTVTLPMEVKEPGARPSAPPSDLRLPTSALGVPRATLLVIDDDPAVRELMERSLSKQGYAVHTAENGARGLELAKALKPSVITLDVMMPGMDGWAVVSALKADPELSDIPVVMLTIVDDQKLGFTLGAADYLTKPIDWKRLTSVLERYRDQAGPGRVLVVEDDASVRELLQRNLEKDQWTVALAENGRVALERIAEARPSLILLDLMMPEMDGFEFMDALRQREGGRDIPVVVITARQLSEEDRRRLNGQVVRIIEKSQTTAEQVLAELRRLMPERAAGSSGGNANE